MLYENSVKVCPACGSKNITLSSGSYLPTGVVVHCDECGKTFDITETDGD